MSANRWKTILAVVTSPFEKEQLAATKAAALARRCGARLTLFNCFAIPQPTPDVQMDSSEAIIEAAIRDRRAALRQLAKRLSRGELRIDVAVEWDFPTHEAIVRRVLESKPDLVVAESHRHGRIARWVLANTDWELIRSCPVPIWFVRTPTLPRRPSVLVGVDPLHAHAKPARLDDRLLGEADALTHQLGGEISIVHAYAPLLDSGPATLIEPLRLPLATSRNRERIARLSSSLRALAERHGVAEERRFIEPGSPNEVLPRLAQSQRVDVLMMGAVSRSLLARPVIGATAERVIDHVSCDVFIVKPAGFKSPVARRRAAVPGRTRQRAA